jgi:hypothetical protein
MLATGDRQIKSEHLEDVLEVVALRTTNFEVN